MKTNLERYRVQAGLSQAALAAAADSPNPPSHISRSTRPTSQPRHGRTPRLRPQSPPARASARRRAAQRPVDLPCASYPTERTLRARIAALDRVAAPDYDATAATAPARRGFWARYEAQVDPDGLLPPDVRKRKARAAWQADMLRAKLAKRRGAAAPAA